MLNSAEAELACSRSMPPVASTDSGVMISAWPMARTTFGTRNCGPA